MPSDQSSIDSRTNRIKKCLEEAKGPSLCLSFFSDGLDSFGADLIGKFLKSNTTVTDLELYGNKFTSVATFMLVKSLKKNTTLSKLTLGGNDFNDGFVLATLAEAINSHPNLVFLELVIAKWVGMRPFCYRGWRQGCLQNHLLLLLTVTTLRIR